MTTEIVLHVEGLEFRADSAADEPRVLDIELGAQAGLARPAAIRDTIKAAIRDGAFREGEHFRILPAAPDNSRGRPATVYSLTEAGALKLMTRLRTPIADACV